MPAPNDIAYELGLVLREWRDVRLALLFGSHARGCARSDSDIDVAVDAPGVDLLTLSARLSQATGHEVDVIALQEAGVPLLEELVRDAMVIHEGSTGAGARWRARALATLETDRPWFGRMRDAWLMRLSDKGVKLGQ
jgi:predicted nucleotidyltransferase